MRRLVILGAICVAACTHDGGDAALPKAVALSPDGSRHYSPTYSHNGKRLAYWARGTDSSGGWQLWVANADLTAPTKLPASNPMVVPPPVWSPDGSRIAASASGSGSAHVVVVTLADGSAKSVTSGAGIEMPLMFLGDGDRLAYFGSTDGTIRSFTMSLATGVTRPLAPSEKRPTFGSPSPDGSHVAYFVADGDKSTIWVADKDGNNPHQLTTEGFESLEQFNEWSPDGKELLYESTRTGTTDLWIVPIDGGKPRQLTHDVRNDYAGAWSPDGKWIAFISDRGRQTDIWLVPSAGGVERRVTDDAVQELGPLTWRAGSNILSYVARTERGGVWSVDLASGQERRLTPDSLRVVYFNLSPDGKQVDFVIDRGAGIQDLAVMPLAGGPWRTLIAGGGTVDQPLWSPDGSKIVFASDRGGTSDIWVVDAATGALRQVENWSGTESNASWSGDGSAIFFQSDRGSGLGDVWKVPVSGGDPVRATTNGTVSDLAFRAGVADLFVVTIKSAGQFGIARLGSDGALHTVWDRTNAHIGPISPSGDSIVAAIEQPDGKLRTMILSSKTGGGRVILKPGDDVSAWSNDGSLMAYTMNVAGATDLAVFNVAHGTTRRLTATPDNEVGAEITSDGKSVVFRRGQIVARIMAVDLTKLLAR